MSQCLKNILKEYLKTNMNIKYLFTNAEGSFISPATINAQFKRICKDAGIRTTTYIFDRNDTERNKIRTIHLKSSSCNCHLLRHTFATRCIESGISPVVLQRILRTFKYRHNPPELIHLCSTDLKKTRFQNLIHT